MKVLLEIAMTRTVRPGYLEGSVERGRSACRIRGVGKTCPDSRCGDALEDKDDWRGQTDYSLRV